MAMRSRRRSRRMSRRPRVQHRSPKRSRKTQKRNSRGRGKQRTKRRVMRGGMRQQARIIGQVRTERELRKAAERHKRLLAERARREDVARRKRNAGKRKILIVTGSGPELEMLNGTYVPDTSGTGESESQWVNQNGLSLIICQMMPGVLSGHKRYKWYMYSTPDPKGMEDTATVEGYSEEYANPAWRAPPPRGSILHYSIEGALVIRGGDPSTSGYDNPPIGKEWRPFQLFDDKSEEAGDTEGNTSHPKVVYTQDL